MTTVVEPFPAWLRDLNRFITCQSGAAEQSAPPADVLVDDEGVTVYMDVPGLRSEDVEIDLENDILTVRGERWYPYRSDDGDAGVRRVERAFEERAEQSEIKPVERAEQPELQGAAH